MTPAVARAFVCVVLCLSLSSCQSGPELILRSPDQYLPPLQLPAEEKSLKFAIKKTDVRFSALDTTLMTNEQLEWLEKELKKSKERWKICFFHDPIYSSGLRHGANLKMRSAWEPLFVKYGVKEWRHRRPRYAAAAKRGNWIELVGKPLQRLNPLSFSD